MGSQCWELDAHFLFTVNHMLATVNQVKEKKDQQQLKLSLLFLKHTEENTLQFSLAALWLVDTAPYGFVRRTTQTLLNCKTPAPALRAALITCLVMSQLCPFGLQNMSCNVWYVTFPTNVCKIARFPHCWRGFRLKKTTTCHPQTVVEETNPQCPLTQKADSLKPRRTVWQSGGD